MNDDQLHLSDAVLSSNGIISADVLIEAGNWPDPTQLGPLLKGALDAILAEIDAEPAEDECELSIVFTNDEAIQALNRNWRSKDNPTNVLSFPAFDIEPGDDMPPVMGDIILAYETVAHEAGLEGKAFKHHLSHLIVHGFLHLLGYDHETEEEAELMEATEIRILERLSIPNPYAETGTFD